MQRYVHCAVLSLCVGFLWFNYFLLDMDWYKQQSALYDLPGVVEGTPKGAMIIFTDHAVRYNWRGRDIGTQEYTGWLDVMTEHHAYTGISYFDFQNKKRANQTIPPVQTHLLIHTNRTLQEPVVKEWVYLKWYELTHSSEELRAEAHRILQVQVDKIPTIETGDKDS